MIMPYFCTVRATLRILHRAHIRGITSAEPLAIYLRSNDTRRYLSHKQMETLLRSSAQKLYHITKKRKFHASVATPCEWALAFSSTSRVSLLNPFNSNLDVDPTLLKITCATYLILRQKRAAHYKILIPIPSNSKQDTMLFSFPTGGGSF